MYFNTPPCCVAFQILILLLQVLLHVLFEHASGYALFAVKEVEEIGMLLPQVRPCSPRSARFLAQMASLSM